MIFFYSIFWWVKTFYQSRNVSYKTMNVCVCVCVYIYKNLFNIFMVLVLINYNDAT